MSKEVEIVSSEPQNNSREVALRETGQVARAEERTADEIKARLEKIIEVQRDAMKPNIDYGVIPGTERKDKEGKDISKPTLLKPGAEKLCVLFNLDAQFSGDGNSEQFITETTDRGEKMRHLLVKRYCTLYSQVSGARLGGASAICSTFESKYQWRQAGRKCPECGKDAIIKGKAEYGGGWLCFAKKGGCGHKWPDGAKEIEGQEVGRVPNLDVADQFNTVIRIGEKRALVAAVRLVTGASAIFDEEAPEVEGRHVEDTGHEEGAGSPEPAKRTRQTKPKTETGAESTGTQAQTGAEPEATLLQQIETAFAAIEYPDDAKREEGRVLFLKMFSLPKEGTWADLWKGRKPDVVAKQADALVKIMQGKAQSQQKAKEAQG